MDCAGLGESYRRRGFAVAPAVFPPDTVARAIAAIGRIEAGARDLPGRLAQKLVWERELPARKRGGIAPEATGDALFLINDLPAFDPQLAALLADPLLLGPVRHLLGSADLRYHFSNATMKRERVGSGISWHRDFPNRYLCPARASFLRVMLCLDGMDPENGATRFVVGSHALSDEAAMAAEGRGVSEAESAQARIETALCPPGSLVFIHPKSVHGGPPNASPRPRRNLIVQWGRADDPLDIATVSGADETLAGFAVGEVEAWLRERA